MTTVTKILSANAYLSMGDYMIVDDEITMKGGSSLKLDLLNIEETNIQVKTIVIDWGDGNVETHKRNIFLDYYNESIIPEVKYNKTGSVCLDYMHTYNPTSSAYFTTYVATVDVYYFNTVHGKFIFPVRMAKASMYDKMGELEIINTQSLSLSSTNTLLNIQTNKDFYAIPIITNDS